MKSVTSPSERDRISQSPQNRSRSHWRILVPLGVLIAGTGLALPYLLSRPQTENLQLAPAETFSFNGQVEGDETNVVPLLAGQIDWVAVREGDRVAQGQEIIQLSSEALQAQLKEVEAQLAAAEQHEQQVEVEREVIREKLWAAYLKLQPEEGALDQRVRNADQDIAAAEAQLAEARNALQRARNGRGYVSGNSVGSAQSQRQETPRQQTINQLETRVRGLEQELRLARGAWVRALSTGLSPYIHSPELDPLRQQWVQVLAKLSDAQETTFQIRAKQQQLEANRRRLTITSPLDGIVTDRQVEPGDRVGVGQPLLTIADSSRLYLEVSLPDSAQDAAQSSQQAKVFLDSDPGQPLQVHVVSIDRPTSAPDKTNTPSGDASKIIVQLSIDNPNSTTLPGEAVEGEIVF